MIKIHIYYNILILIGVILISRLAYLQLFSKKYISNAFNISIKEEIVIPNRGSIFDRNGKILVYNQYIYDLIVTPIFINKNFNINKFCQLIGINEEIFKKKLNKAKIYSKYVPSVFLSHILQDKASFIQEKLYQYKGFEIIKRSLRIYNIKNTSNILGYIGEVQNKHLKSDPNYYQIGDLIGWTGVEKSYEKILRGKKGIKYLEKDRKGIIIGSYNNKKNDIRPIHGDDVFLTIDSELQTYVESLMYKKKGGIVAIDPKTGEILTIVSNPLINPNFFVGEKFYKEVKKMLKDTINNPFFDRATQGVYPPGSSFKILTELAGLQMKVINKNTTFICQHGFHFGNKKIHCHCGIYNIPMNIEMAIAQSCNNYFAQVYKKIIEKYPRNPAKSADEWNQIIKSFGFGRYLKNDLATGQKGKVPSGIYYNKKYPKGWNALTIISNSIGQGEVNVTPIQLANMMAAIANRGFFYTPHIIKAINYKEISEINYLKPKYTKIDVKYFSPIIQGMKQVFLVGTGKHFKALNINMAGKTGTAQNFTKINDKLIALKDHSIFILFAPIENPKIAIAVMIENGGFGAYWAGPIASLIAEKYITKTIQRKNLEKRIMNSGLEKFIN